MAQNGSAACCATLSAGTFTAMSSSGRESNSGCRHLLPNSQSANHWFATGVGVFGQFNLTLDNKDGWNSSATSIIFTLTNTSGTWASASDVLLAQ